MLAGCANVDELQANAISCFRGFFCMAPCRPQAHSGLSLSCY
ncbi:rCG26347, isoform CRA_e [Rattus norvegicus]|uniref:RCG26347, isoform CRA_e n=1 Tax=Rattus norvegicus TaxID=10116 RepID=A6HPW4_RAT|nr:rCG26347, isoform CRA_e [Rattus norvegicus]